MFDLHADLLLYFGLGIVQLVSLGFKMKTDCSMIDGYFTGHADKCVVYGIDNKSERIEKRSGDGIWEAFNYDTWQRINILASHRDERVHWRRHYRMRYGSGSCHGRGCCWMRIQRW